MIIKAGALLSKRVSKIIYNAKVSSLQHMAIGYFRDNSEIIPNGFDSEQFCPKPEARESLRKELDVCNNDILIGLIARYHPMKDHFNFLQAASLLLRQYQQVHFVMVGRDVDWNNFELTRQVRELGISENVHLMGERWDIPEITTGLDIATTSSSWGESFPNVVGEAMSCQVPCVVTDVGDSALIVGNSGLVVPPRDPASMANAWRKLIDLGIEDRQCLGDAARKRIEENYSLGTIVGHYEALYRAMLVNEGEGNQFIR